MKPNHAIFRLSSLSIVLVLLLTSIFSAAQAALFLPGAWTKAVGNPLLSPGTSGAWDDLYAFAPSVILDGSTYKMWYAASSVASTSRKIGYATSPDGTTWTKVGITPVLSPGGAGAWDEKAISFPEVIKEDSTYKMWYTGMDASGIGRVGYATSPDGIVWTKYAGNPVLTVGATGSWDSIYVGQAGVIKNGVAYQMWYRGGSETGGAIGYATSPDGLAWTKQDPVITGGSGAWDDTPYHPAVVFDGMLYHLWYSGCNPVGDVCQVGYATSQDGAQWTRKGVVLALGETGAWDDENADHAAVLQVGSSLMMWYSGFNGSQYQIGYASAVIFDHQIFIPLVAK